jgi:hypothetical protein
MIINIIYRRGWRYHLIMSPKSKILAVLEEILCLEDLSSWI